MRYFFRLVTGIFYMRYIHRRDSNLCYTSWEHRLVGQIVQWVHHERSIRRPISPRAEALPQSYVSLLVVKRMWSILHGVDLLSYFSFQHVLHSWCNKGRGMCYIVCGMVHIKELLLLIGKNSQCGGSGFPFSLSELSLTICLTPYNRK